MSAATPETSPRKWYMETAEEALKVFESSAQGISDEEAARRLQKYGPNELPKEKKKGALYYIWKQINQPLIYVLLLSAVITSYLEEWIDTVVILAVVVANAAIGYIQERKAGEAIEELLKYEVTAAKVRRGGRLLSVSSKELVPGDVVVLHAGDMIPADVRLFSAKDFIVDESLLTGESQGVVKQTKPLNKPNLVPADQVNMAFSGTYVVRGRAEAAVVATGLKMEIGKISEELEETEKESFPLMIKISKFSKILSGVIALAAAFTFALGLLRGYEATHMFRASVALAVAAIPEGLPAMLTAIMALGVQSMARRNAIVRSLPAVETLEAPLSSARTRPARSR